MSTLQPIQNGNQGRKRNDSSLFQSIQPSYEQMSGGGIGMMGPPPIQSPGFLAQSTIQIPMTSRAINSKSNLTAQKQLVNFSVKAQNYILKKELQSKSILKNTEAGTSAFGIGKSDQKNLNSFLDETIQSPGLLDNNSAENFETINSQKADPHKAFQLPQIQGKQSPFKGFLDISIVTQKIKKSMLADQKRSQSTKQGDQRGSNLAQSFEQNLSTVQEVKPHRTASKRGERADKTVQMSPKVLETWINETLTDADHLDIPGTALKAEHKLPISRYQIDRHNLIQQGIPNETVDRIYRGLFVYSVGFYELLNKVLSFTEKKYAIVINIWKVFSILLEYCCRTDYRMLISEISRENQESIQKIEAKYQAQFETQANNEKLIKQNMEILQKYSETLEKERMNERQMRLKLEEEYAQNTKNHEEEVQLRLKFEAKLNDMHGQHRDLNTKYFRTCRELEGVIKLKNQLEYDYAQKIDENTSINQELVDTKNRMNNNIEKIQSLIREIALKNQQIAEYDDRIKKSQDDIDLAQYKLQEQQKDITEMKLKTDILTTTNDSLMSEKSHLTTELKETRQLQRTYEQKCSELMQQLQVVTNEYQDVKRSMISYNEMTKEREDKIEKQKLELAQMKQQFDELDIKNGSLAIDHQKNKEMLLTAQKDLTDTVQKLHTTNKVRHETEIKLGEQSEKNKSLQEALQLKEEQLQLKIRDNEDLEKQRFDLVRLNEQLETKKGGVERQFEQTKKQLNEKIANQNEIINGEKETREMWIERFEKEQKDHSITSAQLLQSKTEHREQLLATKNAEIKFETYKRQCDVLTEQNQKFQDTLNETLAKNEVLERDLNTQLEIMKQFEISKKEYVGKLKHELDTVESRFLKVINENNMVGEDYRSQAYQNFQQYIYMKVKYVDNIQELTATKEQLQNLQYYSQNIDKDYNKSLMELEDYLARSISQKNTIKDLKNKIQMNEYAEQELKNIIEKRNKLIEKKDDQIKEFRQNINAYEDRLRQFSKEQENQDKMNEQKKLEEQKAEEKKAEEKRLLELQNKKETFDAENQTDIGMDYFDRIQNRSHLISDKDISKENNDSSTAFGTVGHGQSVLLDDLVGGLKHNTSFGLDEHNIARDKSPLGNKSQAIHQDVIKEEGEDNEGEAKVSKGSKAQKVNSKLDQKGFPSVMSGQGMRSGQTLREGAEHSGSEYNESSVQSPSLKSLMKSKNGVNNKPQADDQLKESQRINSQKVKGPSSIKNLIRMGHANR